RLHSADRRGRHRQDHDDPLAAGACAQERRDRADPQSALVGGGVFALVVRRARVGRGRQRRWQYQEPGRSVEPLPAARPRGGRRVVLVVDEAQNLAPDVLEQVRLLTNLETETQKLLQIILIGQPELRKLLAREDLRQIAQRITARFHLDPLSREETSAYVRHRLRVAGATTDIFTRAALREIYRVTGGVPRVINIVCDRALLGAYTQELHQVPRALVRRAGAEVFGHELMPGWMPVAAAGLALAVLAGSALLLWRYAPTRFLPSFARTVQPATAMAPPVMAPPAMAATAASAPVASSPLG